MRFALQPDLEVVGEAGDAIRRYRLRHHQENR